jgi:hypothetical protein
MPPNHRLFDDQHTQLSPVLQRRLDAQNNKAAAVAVAPAAPVFNFTIGKEVLDIFRPPAQEAAPAHVGAAVAIPAPPYEEPQLPIQAPKVPKPAIGYDLRCPTLLQPNRLPGPNMTMAVFCAQYNVRKETLDKFKKNFYTDADMLRFITLDELKEMGFLLGEIARLRIAIERWSVLA